MLSTSALLRLKGYASCKSCCDATGCGGILNRNEPRNHGFGINVSHFALTNLLTYDFPLVFAEVDLNYWSELSRIEVLTQIDSRD